MHKLVQKFQNMQLITSEEDLKNYIKKEAGSKYLLEYKKPKLPCYVNIEYLTQPEEGYVLSSWTKKDIAFFKEELNTMLLNLGLVDFFNFKKMQLKMTQIDFSDFNQMRDHETLAIKLEKVETISNYIKTNKIRIPK